MDVNVSGSFSDAGKVVLAHSFLFWAGIGTGNVMCFLG